MIYKLAFRSPQNSRMSRSQQNRLRVAAEILQYGTVAFVPCDRCCSTGRSCIIMEGSSRLKCSECVRSGRSCTNLSWESLDKTREEYRKKVEDDEKELATIIARLLRNKQILKSADDKAKRKAGHQMVEMDKEGELSEVETDCPAADALDGWSPSVWGSLDLINSSVGFGGETVEPIPGNGPNVH